MQSVQRISATKSVQMGSEPTAADLTAAAPAVDKTLSDAFSMFGALSCTLVSEGKPRVARLDNRDDIEDCVAKLGTLRRSDRSDDHADDAGGLEQMQALLAEAPECLFALHTQLTRLALVLSA